MSSFEVLDSPSEMRLRIYGDTLEEVFRHALQAMFATAEPVSTTEMQEVSHPMEMNAVDRETLLIDFLSEALTYSDIHNETYTDVKFDVLDGQHLNGRIIGKKVKGFDIELKAVTYHEVHIVERDGQLTTDLMIDI